MLGAEAASKVPDHVMDGAFYGWLAGEEYVPRCAGRLVEIEMQIAVADVTVGNEPAVGDVVAEPLRRPCYKHRQRGDRQRNIMLQTRPIEALGLGYGLPHFPQCLTLAVALGHDGIEHLPGFERRCQGLGQQLVQLFIPTGRAELAQDVPLIRLVEWILDPRNVSSGELDTDSGDQLEGADPVATRFAQ